MSAPLSPIVSEFETEEQATSYDAWFRAKVNASIENPRPPHFSRCSDGRDAGAKRILRLA